MLLSVEFFLWEGSEKKIGNQKNWIQVYSLEGTHREF